MSKVEKADVSMEVTIRYLAWNKDVKEGMDLMADKISELKKIMPEWEIVEICPILSTFGGEIDGK